MNAPWKWKKDVQCAQKANEIEWRTERIEFAYVSASMHGHLSWYVSAVYYMNFVIITACVPTR